MKSRPCILALLLGLAVAAVGCGDSSRDRYVNFDQTAPSTLDQPADQLEPGSEVRAVKNGESRPVDVKPVSVAKESASDNVNHAVAPEAISPAEDIDSGKQPVESAGGSETAAADVVPASKPSIDPAASTAASDVKTDSSTETVTSEASLNTSGNRVVSPQSGLTGPADNPLIENAAFSEPRKTELLIPEKTFRKERGSSALRVSYDDLDLLKILNMEPVPTDAAEYFPEWLNALNGKSIRIRGFMYPTFEATGLTVFTLARDNGICCFVRQPKIYDIIAVKLADGVTSDYIEGRPFDVEGVLRIEPQADEKDLYRLYRIEDARVLR